MTLDAIGARQRLVDDRHYKYRGCAPDEESPGMAVGDPDVSLDAWGPYTADGAEPQRVRLAREEAAIAICGRCPVLALCRAYANTTVTEGGIERLVEPESILGGELALTRHKALIARRHDATTAAPVPAPVDADLAEARTPQRRALLVALARETDPERVAALAGMDLRKANWHRSALVGMLGLDREQATREQLLAAAVENRLIPRSTRIRPDGRWPLAAAPTTDGVRQRRIAPGRPVQLVVPGLEDMPRAVVPAPALVAPAHRTRPPALARTTPPGPGVRAAAAVRRVVIRQPRPAPAGPAFRQLLLFGAHQPGTNTTTVPGTPGAAPERTPRPATAVPRPAPRTPGTGPRRTTRPAGPTAPPHDQTRRADRAAVRPPAHHRPGARSMTHPNTATPTAGSPADADRALAERCQTLGDYLAGLLAAGTMAAAGTPAKLPEFLFPHIDPVVARAIYDAGATVGFQAGRLHARDRWAPGALDRAQDALQEAGFIAMGGLAARSRTVHAPRHPGDDDTLTVRDGGHP
ncbi:hypothetical protein ACWCPT_29770 [Streptomyces sp. NPDC002308]